jgi:GAF domain-containing protein
MVAVAHHSHKPPRAKTKKVERPDHLTALGDLVEKAFPDPTHFFTHGLNLLVQQFKVDRALMSRYTELGWEAFWWALAEGVEADPATFDPSHGFCQSVLERPGRTLVIRDAENDPVWKTHSGYHRLGIRAYCGAPLRVSGKVVGVLSVQSHKPRNFSRPEIAMLNAMANLFGKTMEVETLKAELHMTREALDLTTAVMEDSALEANTTRLPNRLYLEIWLKANLYLARRRGEAMAVIMWHLPVTRENTRLIREVAEALRGEDLLVDLKTEKFLLMLPRTPEEGAKILVGRIRAKLGEVPMGATIWNPLWKQDRDDFSLRFALERASEALNQSETLGDGKRHEVIWAIPLPPPSEMVDCSQPCW